MSDEILEHRLEQVEIKQTRTPTKPIRFKDEAIKKIRKENLEFGKKRYLYIPFKVDKDTHLRGLKLKIAKGSPGSKNTLAPRFIPIG